MTEDGLVEAAAGAVAGTEIEPVGVFEELKTKVEEFLGFGQIVDDVFELFGELGALAFNVTEPLLDFVAGKFARGGQIEQVIFFDIE